MYNKYLEKIAENFIDKIFNRSDRQDIILKEMKKSPYIYLFHGSPMQDELISTGMFLDKAMESTSDKFMYDKLKDTGKMNPHFNLTSVKDYGKLYTLEKHIPHWSPGKKDPLLVKLDSNKLKLNEKNVRILNLLFKVPENDEWWYEGDIPKDDIIHPKSPEYKELISRHKYLRD